MKIFSSVFPLLFLSIASVAQKDSSKTEVDSLTIRENLKAAYLEKMAWENPLLRQGALYTDVFAGGNIKSNMYGQPFFKGKYQAVRTNAYFSIPLLHIGKNLVTASVGASHQTIHLTDIVNYNPEMAVENRVEHNTLLSPSFNFSRSDKLFSLPVIFSVTASGLIEPISGQTQFSATGLAMVTLRHNDKTTLSVGVIGMVGPGAPFPVIPVISYFHKFKPDLSVSLNPSGLAFRKEINSGNSVSLSGSIASNISLFKRDVVNLPVEHSFSTFEMKTGIVYEHLFSRKIVTTVSVGASSMFTSKVVDGNSGSNTFIKNTQSTVPYVRVGVSFLPFWKGLSN